MIIKRKQRRKKTSVPACHRHKKTKGNENHHIAEQVGKHCKKAHLVPVIPKPPDFFKKLQIIVVLLHFPGTTVPVRKQQKIHYKNNVQDKQYLPEGPNPFTSSGIQKLSTPLICTSLKREPLLILQQTRAADDRNNSRCNTHNCKQYPDGNIGNSRKCHCFIYFFIHFDSSRPYFAPYCL